MPFKMSRRCLISSRALMIAALLVCSCQLDESDKPQVEKVPQKRLQMYQKEGTILNQNYTKKNPHHASIPLGDFEIEPTVVFFGIENNNGVFTKDDYLYISSVIHGGKNSEYTVPGTTGWYALAPDRGKKKRLVGKNYQIRFILYATIFENILEAKELDKEFGI